jgi:hypothetical protein
VKKSWNYGDVMEVVSARCSHSSEVSSGLLVTIRAEAGSRVAGPTSWEVDYAEIRHAQSVNTQLPEIALMILKDESAVTHGSSSQERGILQLRTQPWVDGAPSPFTFLARGEVYWFISKQGSDTMALDDPGPDTSSYEQWAPQQNVERGSRERATPSFENVAHQEKLAGPEGNSHAVFSWGM